MKEKLKMETTHLVHKARVLCSYKDAWELFNYTPSAIWGLTSKWLYYLFTSASVSLFLYFYRLGFMEAVDLHYTF